MKLIGNAFSLGMLDSLVLGEVVVKTTLLSEYEAREWVSQHDPSSCVGHADTALLFSRILGREVQMNRQSTSLQGGDFLLVGQYNGPRLPEGATSLPGGARIRWILTSIDAPTGEYALERGFMEDWDGGPIFVAETREVFGSREAAKAAYEEAPRRGRKVVSQVRIGPGGRYYEALFDNGL